MRDAPGFAFKTTDAVDSLDYSDSDLVTPSKMSALFIGVYCTWNRNRTLGNFGILSADIARNYLCRISYLLISRPAASFIFICIASAREAYAWGRQVI